MFNGRRYFGSTRFTYVSVVNSLNARVFTTQFTNFGIVLFEERLASTLANILNACLFVRWKRTYVTITALGIEFDASELVAKRRA